MKKSFLLAGCLLLCLCVVHCTGAQQPKKDFVRVENGQFIRNGQPYHFIGFNFWYAGVLASEGVNGDRARLSKELDFLKANGIDNLRIMVGADGPTNVAKASPSLQIEPGVYNDTLLLGLDYLLDQLDKRDMLAILFFNNTWEWTGGYSQYLEWAGHGKAPVPAVDTWPVFQQYVQQYMKCAPCDSLFKAHVKNIITRTNTITGRKYSEEPAIMAWQIGNEPRPMGRDNNPAFVEFIASTARFIKGLDPNHMVSVGSEGYYGCEENWELFETIHQDKNIDYLTCHIWPKNWLWIDVTNVPASLSLAVKMTKDYLMNHLDYAVELNKPLVLSEFGFPRDNHLYSREDPTVARDAYYKEIYDILVNAIKRGIPFGGCNMWAWGGFAQPNHVMWQPGDPLTGDPPQEEQGLNSVFAEDSSTMALIKSYTATVNTTLFESTVVITKKDSLQ